MAGDWIKMRVDLQDDPSVVYICDVLDLDEFEVIGRLHKLWAWADKHTSNGITSGVTLKWVDRFLNKTGFADALIEVTWLEFTEGVLKFPGFEIHNGKSAKSRCDAVVRQRVSRIRHADVTKKCDEIVTDALPEKRREEKSLIEREEAFGIESKSVEFQKAWARWKLHSIDKGKSVSGITEEQQLMKLGSAYPDEADAIAAILHSIEMNWRNINTTGDHKRARDATPAHNGHKKTKAEQLDDILKGLVKT